MDWPTAAKEVPKAEAGLYYKFESGANKFRILSEPITGYEYWNTENKPIRSVEYPTGVKDIRPDSKIKHFWAFVVWNFAAEKVQILELTQSTIKNAITDLINSEDWGDPKEYTLTVTKKGEKLETEYSVQPSPKKEIPAAVVKAYEAANINLEALFEGADPTIS